MLVFDLAARFTRKGRVSSEQAPTLPPFAGVRKAHGQSGTDTRLSAERCSVYVIFTLFDGCKKTDETVYLLMPKVDDGCQGWDSTISLEGIETVRKLFRKLVEGIQVSTAWSTHSRNEIDA